MLGLRGPDGETPGIERLERHRRNLTIYVVLLLLFKDRIVTLGTALKEGVYVMCTIWEQS